MTSNIPHIIEVAVLLLIAFLIGCLIGYFLRSIFFKPKAEAVAPKPAPTPAPVVAPTPKSTPKPASASSDGRPKTLDKARGGKKDNLKRIKGIGPKIEGILNKLGIFHFDQIASWDQKTISWVDDYLSFKGRIDREEWIKQAKALAKGEETEFSKRVDKGAVTSSKKGDVSKSRPKTSPKKKK